MSTSTLQFLPCPPQYTGIPELACLPRWGTPRNPERATYGPRVAEVAAKLGHPLMPWQRYVADVALEIDPETGELAYSEVGLTVPRQSGKTLLILALAVHRALAFPNRQNIRYAAQTGISARGKWEDDHLPILENSPFRNMFKVRKKNGSEAILWNNGAKHAPVSSNTEKSGHGETVDLGIQDEAFALVDDRTEQAMKPAMVTRVNSQYLWVSTAGNASSTYLIQKVEMGRKSVSAGNDRGFAFFEWSADPEEDPANPATWAGCMPALGLTVRKQAVQTFQQTMSPNEFRRAFLNLADTDVGPEPVVPLPLWAARADKDSSPELPVALAIDLSPGGVVSSIALAGKRADGIMTVELIENRPGTSWVVERVKDLVTRWNPVAVVLNPAAPAGSLVTELELAGIELLKVSIRDYTAACGGFVDAIREDAIRHRDDKLINTALGDARIKPTGVDGSWYWTRRNTTTDISPLVAITLARHGFLAKLGAYRKPYNILDSVR